MKLNTILLSADTMHTVLHLVMPLDVLREHCIVTPCLREVHLAGIPTDVTTLVGIRKIMARNRHD